jgi:dipeptidyl aminopeptidase/acylaminoacyl peptidase
VDGEIRSELRDVVDAPVHLEERHSPTKFSDAGWMRPVKSLRAALTLLIVATIVVTAAAPANARPYHFITHSAGDVDYWPRFSPDGKTILFSRCEISSGCGGAATTGSWALWTVPLKRGRATSFIAVPNVSATRSNWLWNLGPSITTPIAFTGVPIGPGDSRLWLSDAQGAAPFAVDTPDEVATGYPSWVPDGSAVTVSGQPKSATAPFISLVGVPDGTMLQELTSIDTIWTGESAVSRDGTLMAFAGQLPVAGNQYSDQNNQVWIESIDLTGALVSDTFDPNLHQLDALQARTPDWSPNDRFLIFESTRGCLDGHYAIFMEAASGGEALQVTDCKLDANHGVWSPDGRRFAFSGVFGARNSKCSAGCRGIAIAPVPAKVRKLGTTN